MFNQDVQITFSLAVREAQRRHHEFLTTEHVLYAMLFEEQGRVVLQACGSNIENLKRQLEVFFDQHLEQIESDEEAVPEQTLGLQRVLQRTVSHMQSSGKREIGIGDVLAAILEHENSHACNILEDEGIDRLDVLKFISHGVAKVPQEQVDDERSDPEDKTKQAPPGKPAQKIDPLEAFTVNLLKRAKNGKIDPLVGRQAELERTIQVLCRRRKNNPVLVGEPGVGKTAIAEGLALRIADQSVPELLHAAELYALDMGALLAGTKYPRRYLLSVKSIR